MTNVIQKLTVEGILKEVSNKYKEGDLACHLCHFTIYDGERNRHITMYRGIPEEWCNQQVRFEQEITSILKYANRSDLGKIYTVYQDLTNLENKLFRIWSIELGDVEDMAFFLYTAG